MNHPAGATHAADLERLLGPLLEQPLADLATQLRAIRGLAEVERTALTNATTTALREVLWRQVSRVVVLELNLARLGGALTAEDSEARWQEWVARLSEPGQWQALAEPYPALLPRARTLITNRCAATAALGRRFASDRARLAGLLGTDPGELTEVRFGAGDSHQGGHTVTLLASGGGRLVYKPRPVGVDAVLGRLLPRLLPDLDPAERIRVPRVQPRADQAGQYGWAEYVAHRYCADDDELHCFYRGLGHWLAVMRLLRGSDLHSENVIACGPVPVVVDCETLFTPHRAGKPSGYGAAVDLATDRVNQSVLRTGLLPGRGVVLGWRGVDPSAAGFLPGQQPSVQVPAIIDHGTDRARIGTASVQLSGGANLPSPDPDLGRYWGEVVAGFSDLTDRLRGLDRAGELLPMLAEFASVPVRVVFRDTAAYTELARMLWHPSSLHEPAPAIRQAAKLLARQAKNLAGAPDDPTVIDAEVAELLDGDVPVFVTTPGSGQLAGPRGTRWGPAEDLLATAVTQWRDGDLETDRRVVRATLVAAYLNDGATSQPAGTRGRVRDGDLERRRREQAALVMQQTLRSAVRGEDGTATWVAAVLDRNGYAVRPMGPDLYTGLTGVAITLTGYLREVAADRADEVPELDELQAAVLRTLRMADEQDAVHRAETAAADIRARPDPPGAYLGLGSRIWGWLLLARLGAVALAEAEQRAESLAALLPDAVAADQHHDLLGGMAGAVVPLLRLAEQTGQPRWSQLAMEIGQRLRAQATWAGATAAWPGEISPDGLGGLAHGVTGIGWALARLAHASGDGSLRELAAAGFAWEEALFSEEHGTWWDARAVGWGEPPRSWCNGCVGIGVCAADLFAGPGGEGYREVLARAARAAWPAAFGSNYTICHGDLGAWEVVDRAWAAGVGPPGLTREMLAARVISDLEADGPASPAREDTFQPGLFIGGGGVAYQLLRMHPASDLPSVLLPDPAAEAA